MAKGVYVGFSTRNINQQRQQSQVGSGEGVGGIVTPFRVPASYRTIDDALVITDLINALSIQQGSLPGLPQYGTTVWAYVFEPNDEDARNAIATEVTRVINTDPRITLNTIDVFNQENGVLIQCEISITPFNTAVTAGFFLNRTSGQVTQV